MDIRLLSPLLAALMLFPPHGTVFGRKQQAREYGRHTREPKERDDGVCELELNCKGGMQDIDGIPVKLPIRGPRGPPGLPGEMGEPGEDGIPGLPGIPGMSSVKQKRVAFFVGLTTNMGPVTEHVDIIFDSVITNVGNAYDPPTGRFTAPINGTYQFNVVASAQGRQKAAVMLMKNKTMLVTVWAESVPSWATASNVAILSLNKGEQVWLMLHAKASHLHGYMYSTFSGFLIFEN